ncbi:MAG TPA: helix-turn-helix transcriptional regulator [Azospirillaceae bacterium]|nr:helix-turn-helix transcriptional regulator [Azospirillaceae bacterium]
MPRRTKNAAVASIETAIETHVAARIRLRRGLLGMSQSDLARALGITFQQVQKYERGSNRVSVGKLFRLADILDVPLSFFFDGLEMTGVENAPKPPTGFAEDQSPLLSRRDLDLLRAWRQSPPAVADAIAILLRAVSQEEEEAEGVADGAEARGDSKPPASRRRRRAVWDPSDIAPGSRKA